MAARALLLAACLGLVASGSTAAQTSSPRVAEVVLRSDAALDDAAGLRELIALQAGDAFDPEAVRRSLRNLQASGVAGEIEALTTTLPEGVRVTFVLWAKIQVEAVELEGRLGMKAADLRPLLPQRAAQPLIENRVLRGLYRLQDHYRAEGYLGASVRLAVAVDDVRKRAVVIYRIDSGPPATVGGVELEGDAGPFRRAELLARLKAPPGRRYRQELVRADAERLEDWLVERGHRQAVVQRPVEKLDDERHLVHLTYALNAGPRYELEVLGADAGKLAKRGLLPFSGRERFDDAVLLQSESRLRDHYQGLGHYQAAVAWREERADGVVKLRLSIERGPLFSLEELRFTGNDAIGANELQARVTTSPRRLLEKGSGRLVDSTLESDLANLRSFYQLRGYARAEVGPPRIEVTGGEISVTVPIREGPQRRVVGVRLEGATSFDPAALLATLPLRAGGPFHPRLLEESLDRLRARYEQVGYEAAQLSSSVGWNAERTLADVTLRVLEGPQSRVDRVILRGNERTRAEVVRRAMRLENGAVLNSSRLLEVQRNLYALGIFSRVEVTRAPGTPYSGRRDVLVRVEEGHRQKIVYGLGYDSEDGLRGLLGYTHGNLWGRAVSGRFDLRASERDRQVRTLLRQPYLFRRPLPTTYSLFRIEEDKESFDSKRSGAQVEVQRLGDHTRVGLLFTYKLVEVENPDPALESIEIDRELREVQVASLTPNIQLDHRDDPLDPKRGWSANVQAEYAFPLLEADAEFIKLFGQQTAYLDLGRPGVLAGSLRVGAIEPLGSGVVEDPTLPPGLASRRIPISERYFAGGRTSHRAYRRDRLGIPGETLLVTVDETDFSGLERLVPVGGNGLVLVNLDYRFPIAGPVGGTVFVDAGNVWADWRDVDPAEIKTGAGLGIRYLSPIGPLRLEVGWKLDQEPGEDPFVVLFSFGNPF